MRRINEVLRLRFELGLGQREIARACSISQGAVHNYLKKVSAAGISWPFTFCQVRSALLAGPESTPSPKGGWTTRTFITTICWEPPAP